MNEPEDLYEVLQVHPAEHPDVIHAAYRRLTLLYHPDRNPSSDAAAMMQRINRAWETLGNADRRVAYDRSRTSQQTPGIAGSASGTYGQRARTRAGGSNRRNRSIAVIAGVTGVIMVGIVVWAVFGRVVATGGFGGGDPGAPPTPVNPPSAVTMPAATPIPAARTLLLIPVVMIGGVSFNIELAESPEEVGRGLSGRDSLAPGAGMLFVHDKEQRYTFWMKDMRFPLDLLWIDAGCTVTDISAQVPAPEPGQSDRSLPLFSPETPVLHVLEINGGAASGSGISIGDAVRFAGSLEGRYGC